MIHWYLLTGYQEAVKGSETDRDKYDVFSKSYIEQLIWYYTQYVEDMTVMMPDAYRMLTKKLSDDYPSLHFNRSSLHDTPSDFYIIMDSQHVIADSSWIKSMQSLKDVKGDVVRSYYAGKQPVALLLSRSVMNKLQSLDPDMARFNVSLQAVEALLLEYFDQVSQLKIKKKNIISIHELKDIQAFMRLLNLTKQETLLADGVLIWDESSTWVEPDVVVAKGTVIYPGTFLRGDTEIGENCLIGPGARIENSVLGCEIAVKDSTIISSKIDDQTTVGPYAYLRPKSDIGKNVKVGDFVEVKNARIDDGSKVSHLSYIGDGHIGKDVNIGCGTVFVNYDGKNKHRTVVEDNCFIGCNANLVAPVTIAKGSYVAAGSTITDDVEAGSLAIARARQVVKHQWMSKKK